MPANLPPQYQKAEEEYRRAQSPQEQVECLERMLVLIPKHKGTEKVQADLKTRLKEAREEVTAEKQAPKKASKSYRVLRQGAGQVVLLGAPNAGKSHVLASLTNAKPEVAPYPFTTREPLPAMMPWKDVAVQLIDTPPVTDAHMEAYLPGMVRSADAVLLCFDGSSDDAPEQTEAVIRQFADRKTLLAEATGFAEDNFAIVHVQTKLLVTRADDPDHAERLALFRELTGCTLAALTVELERPGSVEALRDPLFTMLNVIRVYTKAPGKKADYSAPFTIPAGGTVEDVAGKVHRDLVKTLKFAKVWGSGVHDGQSVGADHVLHDGDLVELHT